MCCGHQALSVLPAVGIKLVIVHSEQQLCQVGGRAVHLHPGDDVKEETRVSAEVLGDAVDLCLLPGGEAQLLRAFQ